MPGELAMNKNESSDLIRKAAEKLKSFGAKEVYVFGSAAEGKMRADSDIDMAVSGLPAEAFFEAMGEASAILGGPLDLISLDWGGPFVEHLRRKGRLKRVA